MNVSRTIIGAIALSAIVYGGYRLSSSRMRPQTTSQSTPSTPISLSTVASHATIDACYIAIDGAVYDVTPYIKSAVHPGGDRILQGCGKDASSLYSSIERGRGHSAAARTLLAKYKIGTLVN